MTLVHTPTQLSLSSVSLAPSLSLVLSLPQAYLQAIEDFKKENPDAARGYTTTDAWWEREEFQRSRRRSAEREQEKAVMVLDERTKEIESIAKEWAKREYFRQSMAGTISKDTTEDEYVKSVWERALFEGDLKYRQMKPWMCSRP